MTEQELLNAAKTGNIGAIEDYADCLIENKKWHEALDWLRKGAHSGSMYCMMKNAHLTVAMVEATINITTGEAANCLKDLEQAEKWVNAIRNAGKLDDEDVLSGTHGLYSEMVWCHYLTAIKTASTNDYKAVIERYRMITATPTSRATYAYIMALEEMGKADEVVKLSEMLINHHDDTVKDFMMEAICAGLSQAYFEGNGAAANYEKAYEYVKLAAQYNPDCELVNLFESGNARKAFNAKHRNAPITNTSTKNSTSSGGCYVATAVYGSYDCPQVWTLRRFRDDVLASSFVGRLFIRTYYAISPTLVKWFGHCDWFRNLWKPTLDRMVAKLNANGTADTPYQDRSW